MPRPKGQTPRNKRFELRLSGEEESCLVALATAYGVSAADFVRLCIRKEYAYLQAKENELPQRQPGLS